MNEPIADFSSTFHANQVVRFTYINEHSQIFTRTVRPRGIYFGTLDGSTDLQWILRAWDFDKRAERNFALKNVSSWRPHTAPVLPRLTEKLPEDEWRVSLWHEEGRYRCIAEPDERRQHVSLVRDRLAEILWVLGVDMPTISVGGIAWFYDWGDK